MPAMAESSIANSPLTLNDMPLEGSDMALAGIDVVALAWGIVVVGRMDVGGSVVVGKIEVVRLDVLRLVMDIVVVLRVLEVVDVGVSFVIRYATVFRIGSHETFKSLI